MTIALAGLAAGIAAGWVMARWGLCFNRGLRRAAFERRPAVLRAFAIAVAVQLVVLPVLVVAGVDPLVRSADGGGPALLPVANVVGGLVFGAGMALAGGCVTGMLWKAGAGAVALALAIAGFAAGELLVRGPGDGIIGALDDAAGVRRGAVPELLGAGYEPVAVAIGVLALALLLSRGLLAIVPGVALGAVAAAAWVAADVAGYGYGLGFVGAAEGTRAAAAGGSALPFQLFLAAGVVAGGTLAARGALRLPDGARAARAVAGGLLMGAGGSVAHGCNIGHGVTGLPLLSLGSLVAIAAMSLGALATWRWLLQPRSRLRGRERQRRH